MKIRKMEITNFRCLRDVHIEFDDKLTLIIGENDAGKSSLLDCIRAVTLGRPIELTDFSFGQTDMKLIVIIDDFEFESSYRIENGMVVSEPLLRRPTAEYLVQVRAWLKSAAPEFDDDDAQEKLRETARLFGVLVRANSRSETLYTSLLSALEQSEEDPDFAIKDAKFPDFSHILLDGTQFEDVSAFFKEVFLKERQSSLWQEQVDESRTIQDVIEDAINRYAEQIAIQLGESGIKEKIKVFLPTLTDIRIVPDYSQRDFNLGASVRFLEPAGEIDLQKKGDGTKRRITMALLELKRDRDLVHVANDTSTLYVLDEPDTHLHVKAQLELLDTLRGFSQQGHQVILATHSPFLINAVSPQNILMLCRSEDGCSRVKAVRRSTDGTDQALQALGIENVFLYFARSIILVEGQTEQAFLHEYFARMTGRELSANLTRIVNVEGICNIYGFSRAISEIHDPSCVYIVHDNEMSEEEDDLIKRLCIPLENRYILGRKEFEDAFSPEALFVAWRGYLAQFNKEAPEGWNVESIMACKKGCLEDETRKFSSELRHLSVGSGKPMKKPIFGAALAKYTDENEIPQRLVDLIANLQKMQV